jgi:hypothetical protein
MSMKRILRARRKRVLYKAWLLVALLLLALPLVASAQGRAQLYLLPPADGVATGQSVTVDIVAEGVSNLYGAEVHLRFDPAVVQLADADPEAEGVQLIPGSLLDPAKGFVVANEADNQAGTAVFAITLVNPAPPVEGGGVLAQVTLIPQQPGPLRLELESAKLVTQDLQTLEVSLSGLEVAASGQPVVSSQPSAEGAQAPVNSSPQPLGLPIWMLVLVALVMVGIPLVGVWFIFTQRNEGPPQSGNHPVRNT